MVSDCNDVRQKALSALRKYKGGWLNLGETLVEINVGSKFKDWGYDNFWDYCKEELGMTAMTIKEMMLAYEFIEQNEPSSLNQFKSNPDAYIPDFHTLATLSKKRNSLGEEKSDVVRDTLFNASEGDFVSANKQAKELLSDSEKSGEQIMDDIKKKTVGIQKRMKKLDNDIHNTSSFDNNILETSEKLAEMIKRVNSC